MEGFYEAMITVTLGLVFVFLTGTIFKSFEAAAMIYLSGVIVYSINKIAVTGGINKKIAKNKNKTRCDITEIWNADNKK